jgi:outer membrane lipoprotein-sorting protein
MTKRRMLAHGLVSLALLCASGSACRSERRVDSLAETSEQKPKTQSNSAPGAPAPLKWEDVASAYDRLSAYVCLYEKEELAISNGELQTMRLSFRKPFDVRLDWLNDRGKVDQTAVYRQGANNGKVLARQSGLGSLLGTMRLDPNESLALEDSRHPITEAGLGKLIERLQRDAATPGLASRFLGEETLDGRPAYKFEFKADTDKTVGGLVGATSSLIWIDREMKLPLKLELYGATNTLLERHRFKDIVLNAKLTDKTFVL